MKKNHKISLTILIPICIILIIIIIIGIISSNTPEDNHPINTIEYASNGLNPNVSPNQGTEPGIGKTSCLYAQLTFHDMELNDGGFGTVSENVTRKQFMNFMDIINKTGKKPCKFSEYYDKTCPCGSTIIVFDDARKSVVTKFKPILNDYGFHAVVGVIGYPTENNGIINMDWNDLQQWIDENNEIAYHSFTHGDMTNFSLNQRIFEFESKNIIEERLHTRISTFIFPENINNPRLIAECLQYYVGCTGKSSYTSYDTADFYMDGSSTLNRIKVENTTSIERFQRIIDGLY